MDAELLRTIVICLTAFGASALTFFSGFGLGTLLMPVFALFYPIDVAVASTAVVHFLNSLFKLVLVGKHADRSAVIRFGLPAILAAIAGAWLLVRLPTADAKVAVGLLLIAMTAFELTPAAATWKISPKYLPIGGALSGLLGGMSGMQGALRSAFLIRLGLPKEAFIGTGVVCAALVDLSRLSVYASTVTQQHEGLSYGLLGAAVTAAFAGAVLGNRFLHKVTLHTVQRIVGLLLLLVGSGLVIGLL